jgi:diguanylate cyclase (GGDEF)-like protein
VTLFLENLALLTNIDKFFSTQSPFRLAVILITIVSVIGLLDDLTGYEISFSIFYLIPVGIGSWYSKKYFGFFICLVSAVTWFSVEYTSGHYYSHVSIPYWNTLVRLGFFVVVAILIQRLKSTLDYNKSLAQIDGLTGLLNIRTFKQRCFAQFQLASRHNHSITLGYLDLDNFKHINDNHGHSVGDEVLRQVGNALKIRLRAYDIGARLGGDEFSILLPDTDYPGAQAFFYPLQNSLLRLARSNHWPLSVSIGVAVFHTPSTNLDEAIQIADALMYKVKKSGKNSILIEEYGNATSNTPPFSASSQLSLAKLPRKCL